MEQAITLKFHFFAALKDNLGPESVDTFSKEITLKEIKQYFANEYPNLAQWFAHCQYAVNEEIIHEDYEFKNQDTIYVLPAASGG